MQRYRPLVTPGREIIIIIIIMFKQQCFLLAAMLIIPVVIVVVVPEQEKECRRVRVWIRRRGIAKTRAVISISSTPAA